MEQHQPDADDLRCALRYKRTPRLMEWAGFLFVAICLIIGVRLAHLPFDTPDPAERARRVLLNEHLLLPQPEPLHEEPMHGKAIWLGMGGVLGLCVGVLVYYSLYKLLVWVQQTIRSNHQANRHDDFPASRM